MRSALVALAVAAASPALAAGKFTLKSADVKPGATLTDQQVFNGFGCSGANVSPQLSWTDPPAGTKSFVVTVYDPDAPTGSGWWHWVVYDIPATARELAQGAGSGKAPLPEGAKQGKTDFGAPGFGGACPPPGDRAHRYVFSIYALKVDKLDVPADASPALIGYMTRASSLGSSSFTATYGRKK
jgi:Raf kinase inhibitor-like YbhB/YbcL family protein